MQKKTFKSGILIAILCIPAFVFIFLKIFGKNNFDLPYFFPEIDSNGEVKTIKGDTVFNIMPDFKLLTQDSVLLDSKTLSQDIKIISFFFTRCTTICPPTNQNLNRIRENFKANENVKILSISIDPANDTPSELKKYAQTFGNLNNKWFFMTGEKKYIYDLAIKGFKLPVADASEYDKNIKNIDETFIHSDKLLLIDNKGFCRGIYSATDKFEIERLMVEIKVLLKKK